jgi:hypothetical protein
MSGGQQLGEQFRLHANTAFGGRVNDDLAQPGFVPDRIERSEGTGEYLAAEPLHQAVHEFAAQRQHEKKRRVAVQGLEQHAEALRSVRRRLREQLFELVGEKYHRHDRRERCLPLAELGDGLSNDLLRAAIECLAEPLDARFAQGQALFGQSPIERLGELPEGIGLRLEAQIGQRRVESAQRRNDSGGDQRRLAGSRTADDADETGLLEALDDPCRVLFPAEEEAAVLGLERGESGVGVGDVLRRRSIGRSRLRTCRRRRYRQRRPGAQLADLRGRRRWLVGEQAVEIVVLIVEPEAAGVLQRQRDEAFVAGRRQHRDEALVAETCRRKAPA